MFELRLEQAEKRFRELSDRLNHPGSFLNSSEFQKIAKEQADLEPLALKIKEYRKIAKEREETLLLANGNDAGMKFLAREEIQELEKKMGGIEKTLKNLMIPKDPNGGRNALIEIRAGTGGEEAALFAADLFRMYSRFIEKSGMALELLDASPTEIGGFKEIILLANGKNAYGKLRFESGTHRVQRIPRTEASGRIHTSAATVVVLPEAEEVEVEVKNSDLRIDTFCSSGAGGQSVNTTYSAVRITHIPSGIVAQCQDERSQLKNKARALKVLYARLKERADRASAESASAVRKSQVGSGDRSEKIRTYNFPQNRVTDHRIGLTLYRLDWVLEGNLQEFVEALALARQEEQMKEQE